jgi:hypothetical protein
MPVTITAGITFSGGGLSMSFAPPSQATAGWYAGSYDNPYTMSYVQRITFATDTASASVRGPLSSARYGLAAAGNLDYGWFGGGGSPGISTVDRITYVTDTATATVRGPLNDTFYFKGATGTSTVGYWAGGWFYSKSSISKITYATDTATSTATGPLSQPRTGFNGITDKTTYGWFGGGYGIPAPGAPRTNFSDIERITYASDTSTAVSRGSLPTAVWRYGSTNNDTYGWYACGSVPGSAGTQNIYRLTFATDTATASSRGTIPAPLKGLSGSGNDTYGWYVGGQAPSTNNSTSTYKVTYATDTAAAATTGGLFTYVYNGAAAAGIQ